MSSGSEDYHSLRVPAFCPVCRTVMRGSKCSSSFYSWGCCINCQIYFVEGREAKWKSGWRPSQQEIDAMVENLYRG